MRTAKNKSVLRIVVSPLAFVDRQKAVIERQGQKRHCGTEGLAVLALQAAVVLLQLLEVANELAVPFLPGVDVALKQGLGLVVPSVFGIPVGRLLDLCVR